MIVLLPEFGQETLAHSGAGLMSEAQAMEFVRLSKLSLLGYQRNQNESWHHAGKPMLEHERDTNTRGSATVVSLLDHSYSWFRCVIEATSFR